MDAVGQRQSPDPGRVPRPLRGEDGLVRAFLDARSGAATKGRMWKKRSLHAGGQARADVTAARAVWQVDAGVGAGRITVFGSKRHQNES